MLGTSRSLLAWSVWEFVGKEGVGTGPENMFTSAIRTIAELELLPEDLFYVTVNGRIVDWKSLDEGANFQLHFRLRGGKGGFGSLLRSFRIHRSTNQLMCRDLSGRRLADIKEEEKLRKWIEKAGEREEEKRRQRQEKYEKLKAGPVKHDFNDPDFIQTREKIMDETDEAFEAGIVAAKNKRSNEDLLKSKQQPQVIEDDDSEEETAPKRRRMMMNETLESGVPKLDKDSKNAVTVVSDDADRKCYENEKEKMSPREIAVFIPEKESVVETSVKKSCAIETKIEKSSFFETKESGKVTNFDINLNDYDSAEKLESLGLDQLKYALEVRGLKCGGSLAERAVRLYSIKGLKPDQYPKNIRAHGRKK
uniref:Replication stress response regulator SDE2 n=1 Tax=Setaria digitata TaxID=48799 RepID=A0A915PNX7_9BILA